jgi:hypothetical protein
MPLSLTPIHYQLKSKVSCLTFKVVSATQLSLLHLTHCMQVVAYGFHEYKQNITYFN